MMTYPSYKEVDSDWLSRIPSHWALKRHKDLSLINRKSLPNDTEPFYQFRYIDISNVNQQGIENDPELIEFHEAPSRARRILREKDIIISTVRTYLKAVAFINFQPKNYIASTGFAVLTPRSVVSPEFLAFYCQSDFFIDLVVKNSKGVSYPAINATELSCFTCVYPPLPEQQAIAQFLGTKTQAINKKVTLLEQKIDYYKELQKSLINDTVTKGLDKSVTLKTTEIGIEVPEAWNRYRLKDIGKLYSGLSGKSGDDFRQDNHPDNKGFIPFTNIAANTYISKDNLGKVVVGSSEKQNGVKKGDIFFLMSSEGYEDIGKSSVLNIGLEQTYLNSFCKGYRLKSKKFDSHFINYLLQSDSYRQLLIVEGKGFTRINLKMEKVNDFFIHLPSTKEEQTKIAEYLDDKTTTIDKIVENITDQIDRLKELRKTLINDAVTGKIRVFEPAENKVQA